MNWNLDHLFTAGQLALILGLCAYLLYHVTKKLVVTLNERLEERFRTIAEGARHSKEDTDDRIDKLGESIQLKLKEIQDQLLHMASERPTRYEVDAKVDSLKMVMASFGPMDHPFRRTEDKLFGAPPQRHPGGKDDDHG